MNCPICGKEIPIEPGKLIRKCEVYQPLEGMTKGGKMEVCGQYFTLIKILDTLREIKYALTSGPAKQHINDMHGH